MPSSGPAPLHCRTASYPPPREIIGPGRLPPAAPPWAAPSVPRPPRPLRPPSAAGPEAAAPSVAVAPAPPRAPPAPGARVTTGAFGERARLAATAAFTRATLAVYGTDMLSSR